MKELKIPYIGIKIESIPTILTVLSKSKDDSEFIAYYEKLGKSRLTADEYLRSLRNLELAKKTDGNTRLTSSGKALLEDDLSLFYQNLAKHCLIKFPDLKLVKNIVQKSGRISLNQLLSELRASGNMIRRKQTSSSFLKLLSESGQISGVRSKIGFNSPEEPLEYNQFLKLLHSFSTIHKEKKYRLSDFFSFIKEKFFLDIATFSRYLIQAQREHKILLYSLNTAVVNENKFYVKIDDRYYYYLEVLK